MQVRFAAFPPNRVLREGELPCGICGSGIGAHADGQLGHPFPPPPWSDPAGVCTATPEEVLNRGLFGRFRWLLFGR